MDFIKNLFILEYSPQVDFEDLAFQMTHFTILRIASFLHPEIEGFHRFLSDAGDYKLAPLFLIPSGGERKTEEESRNPSPFLDHSS